jgi:hypothetical protein
MKFKKRCSLATLFSFLIRYNLQKKGINTCIGFINYNFMEIKNLIRYKK